MNNEKSVVIEIYKPRNAAIVNCQEKEVGIETRKQSGIVRQFIGQNSKGKGYLIRVFNNQSASVTCGYRNLDTFNLYPSEYSIKE